jgi:RNA polymerase sigma-70 factor, ECF subfamily
MIERASEKAVRLLFACEPALRRWLSRRVDGGFDLDDLVQESLISAWLAWPTFKGNSSLSTWLHGIAKRRLWNFYRSGKVRPPLLELDACSSVELAGASPSDLEARLVDRICLESLAEGLREDERALFERFYRDRRSIAEIAEGTGLPEGTVKYKLFALRARLRACF